MASQRHRCALEEISICRERHLRSCNMYHALWQADFIRVRLETTLLSTKRQLFLLPHTATNCDKYMMPTTAMCSVRWPRLRPPGILATPFRADLRVLSLENHSRVLSIPRRNIPVASWDMPSSLLG